MADSPGWVGLPLFLSPRRSCLGSPPGTAHPAALEAVAPDAPRIRSGLRLLVRSSSGPFAPSVHSSKDVAVHVLCSLCTKVALSYTTIKAPFFRNFLWSHHERLPLPAAKRVGLTVALRG